MKRILNALFFLMFVCPSFGEVKYSYSFELFGGSQFNIPLALTIRQEGQEDIKVNRPEYKSEAFKEAPYYAYRFGLWKEYKAWELELVHQKIILKNKPENVQHFEISHGYNLITINRAFLYPHFILRVGGGIVLTHPESTIRNKENGYDAEFPNGFYISGPTVQIAIARRIKISPRLFGCLETKFTSSYAIDVPVVDGSADVPHMAVHLLFGIGYHSK
ncbi:MAG: hypothetical protein AB1630_02060 [bacterium]